MKEREIREYLTDTDRNPFREWLHALRDLQARARIRVRLNRIRLGNLGDCRPVGEGVRREPTECSLCSCPAGRLD